MAISVRSLYEVTKEKYKIKLVAGNEGLDNDVRWMYFMEDLKAIDFLYGREFVITTGFGMNNSDWLLSLAKKLSERNSAALMINVGEYINEIPRELIDYCNLNQLPIFTIPWEIHIVDIVKDYCTKIFLSNETEETIANALNNIITNYDGAGESIKIAEDAGFDRDGQYIISLIEPDNLDLTENNYNVVRENIKISIRDSLNRNFNYYNIIEKNNLYLIVIKSSNINLVKDLLTEIYYKIKNLYKINIKIGLGSSLKGLLKLYSNYKRAKAALIMAKSSEKNLISFNEMGIYRAIFTAENKDVLQEMYNEKLGKLNEYDKEHNTNLKETLKLYLSNNKSIQAVSDKSYVHRNTVNYRIKKIKEILHCDFESYKDVFSYELAFFIEDALNNN